MAISVKPFHIHQMCIRLNVEQNCTDHNGFLHTEMVEK